MKHQPVETTVFSLDKAPPKRRRPRPERHLTLYRVGALTVAGRRELCLIKNVSAGGMLIRAYSEIPVGTHISIELKHHETVCGTVQWVDNDSVGICFDRPIDVISLISLPTEGPRPRMPRIEVDCMATVRDGSTVMKAKAINISQGGLRVESWSDLTIGSNVVVSLHGLTPEAAQVKWRDGDHYGLVFNRTLSITQLVAWLQQRHQAHVA